MNRRNFIKSGAAARALMSNARCLTEGVDVPAVDMVAFLSPRRSRVDIVQATGRAMRRSPGKTTGYVLVPLYVEQAAGETIEQAVARAEFDEVWDVLQSLQEQDEVLAEIIREMREQQGRTKGFDDARFLERVEIIGPAISLEILQIAIITKCIERLGSSWDEHFGELKAFKAQFGHCNVPKPWPENSRLTRWVSYQRELRSSSKLSTERTKCLDEIGFVWEPQEASWEDNFATLTNYKAQHGHCNVPVSWKENRILARWVVAQRQLKKSGVLAEERVYRLERIGFQWTPRNAHWEEMFAALTNFKVRFGHTDVPLRWVENPKLARGVSAQRNIRKLSETQKRHLNQVGFRWDPFETAWEEMFAELAEFRRNHGHCNVPRAWPESPKLASWVLTQRQAKKKGKFDRDRLHRLEKMGFEWDPFNAAWEEMFTTLMKYKQEHGHCNVPTECKENSTLARWVINQRSRRLRLPIQRTRRLEQIGFVWDPQQESWEVMFSALVKYRHTYGNCNVPSTWRKTPRLSRWVVKQRINREKLSDDQIRKLEKIGFDWDPFKTSWEEMFARLIKFKKRYGHYMVCISTPSCEQLGRWVIKQRTKWKRGRLSEEQISRMNRVGFQWEGRIGGSSLPKLTDKPHARKTSKKNLDKLFFNPNILAEFDKACAKQLEGGCTSSRTGSWTNSPPYFSRQFGKLRVG